MKWLIRNLKKLYASIKQFFSQPEKKKVHTSTPEAKQVISEIGKASALEHKYALKAQEFSSNKAAAAEAGVKGYGFFALLCERMRVEQQSKVAQLNEVRNSLRTARFD